MELDLWNKPKPQQRQFGHEKTARSEENVAAVRAMLEETPRGVSARRNPVQVTKSSFNKITRLDLRWHPYRMHVRHELYCQTTIHVDCAMRNGLINAVETPFLQSIIIQDEARFSMNREVITPTMCARIHRRDFHRHSTTNTAIPVKGSPSVPNVNFAVMA